MVNAERLKGWIDLVAAVAKVLVVLALLILIVILRRPIQERLSTDLQSFEAFGVRVEFYETQLTEAIRQGQQADSARWRLTTASLSSIQDRAQRVLPVLIGKQLLWLDDRHPNVNLYERRALAALGISVDMVNSISEATTLLGRTCYDGVITDMRQDQEPEGGQRLLDFVNENLDGVGVAVYVGNLDRSRGTPPHAVGITNRAGDLIHFVIDMLDRRGTGGCLAPRAL